MATELAVAYVSIVPETSKIAPGVRKALGAAEKTADSSGQSMGSKLSAALGSTLKRSAIGVGVSAGAAIGAGLTKGIGRLNGIEQAEAKLRGLGHSADSVGSIMDNALSSVKGTSFGLEEAATVAASAVAAGIKPGQELETTLKTVGDTAAIAGTSMSEMGAIFGSVAARGKLQGDDLLQLTSRGVPVLQMLGKELGKTSEEISAMVSKGEIDFKTFESALRQGVGGSALEAGNTVKGAMKNMGAAAGRLGATIAGPFFNQAAGGFRGVTDALDSMNVKVKPVMEQVDRWLVGTGIPAFKKFGAEAGSAFDQLLKSDAAGSALASTKRAIEQITGVAKDAGPAIATIAGALVEASASLGVSTWDVFVTTLQLAAQVLDATLVPALQMVADFAEHNQTMVTAMVAAWMAFKTVPSIMSKVTGALTPIKTKTESLKSAMTNLETATVQAGSYGAVSMGRFGSAIAAVGQKVPALAKMQAAFTEGAVGAQRFARTTGVVKGAMSGIQSAAGGVMNMFGGPWGVALMAAGAAATYVANESAKMRKSVELNAESAKITADAYTAMFEALSGGQEATSAASQSFGDLRSHLTDIAENGPGAFTRFDTAVSGVINKIPLLASEEQKATQSSNEHWRDTADAAERAGEAFDKLGWSNDQVAQAITGSDAAFENLRQKLIATGEGGDEAASHVQKLRDEFLQAQRTADALGPAGAKFGQVMEEISQKAGTAEDRASKLRIALMELAGVKLSAAEASAEMTKALDRVSQQMDQFAGATMGANGAIDTTTTAGAAAHDALMGIGDAMQRSVASGNDVNQVYGQFSTQLAGLKDSLGLTDAEYQKLLDTYGLTPEKLQTTAELQADPAKAAAAGLKAELDKLGDGQKEITMQVHDEAARQQLQDLGFKVGELQKDGTVKINVDNAEARAKLDDFVLNQMPKVDGKTPTAHAILDASQLFATNEFAAAQLYTLDLKRPTPLANMDVSQLNARQIEALQKVGLLDGQKPTPDAFLDISALSGEQQAALAKVFALDEQRPTPLADLTKEQLDAKAEQATSRLRQLHETHTEPVVTANTDQAITALGGVKSLLGSLKDKILNVFVRRHDEGGGHATGGRFATGGKLPKYATGDRHDGYRIPTTGRGSNGTDKWLALNEDNIPVARLDHGEWIINRRSSAKYDKELAAINAGTFPKLPGYANGGVFDDILGGQPMPTANDYLRFARGERVNGFQASRPLEGAPYIWGGSNWGDCSGTASAFAAFGLGIDPFPRKFATMSEEQWLRSHGARMGRGPAGTLRIGWANGGPGGGHTAVTLPDGTNAEMGGARGNGQLGGQAAGGLDGQFTNFAWIPASSGTSAEDPVVQEDLSRYRAPAVTPAGAGGATGGDPNLVPLDSQGQQAAQTVTEAQNDPNSIFYGTGANSWSDLAGNIAKATIGGHVADILGVLGIPNELPPLIKAGQQWYQMRQDEKGKQRDAEKDRQALLDTAQAVEDSDGGVKDPETGEVWSEAGPVPAEPQQPAAAATPQDAVRAAMRERGWDTGAQWDAVDFIVSHESGWNPTAVNPSSGAFGLFQFLGATKDTYLPDSNPDPEVQGRAGARYIADRYGSPIEARRHWEANRWYDRGGVAAGKGHMLKNTLDPERVLSPAQTRAFEDLVYNQLPSLANGGSLAPFAGEVASTMVSEAASAAVDTAVQGVAGAAAAIPGAGALAAGGPVLGAVGKLGADAASWYAGQVTSGVVGSVEQFGRDMLSIPMQQLESLAQPLMPVIGQARAGLESLMAHAAPSGEQLAPVVDAVRESTSGGDTYQFISRNDDAMFSKYRLEMAKQSRGKVGAR